MLLRLCPPVHGVPCRRLRKSPHCASSLDVAAQPAASGADATHVLPGGTAVHLFGVGHLSVRPEVGDFILRNRPECVVVETAVTPEHGATHRSRCGAGNLSRSGQAWHATALNITAHLQASGAPSDSPLWAQVRGAAPAEQVALVAALCVNSVFVFGDRPKLSTVHRLLSCTASDLDAAFGRQAANNFAVTCGFEERPGDVGDVFDRVVLSERDAVLHATLLAEASAAEAGSTIVGLLGGAHFEAVSELFAQRADAADVAPLLVDPEPSSPVADLGVRRAIMERLLLLRAPEEAVAELLASLEELPFNQVAPYEAALETYSSWRMLLACLTPSELANVASSAKGVDLFRSLQPVRDCRPSLGGRGWSDEALTLLRSIPDSV